MDELKCADPGCNNKVDALHMDDEGFCEDCHDRRLDGLLIEESEETRSLSDESLDLMVSHPVKIRSIRRYL